MRETLHTRERDENDDDRHYTHHRDHRDDTQDTPHNRDLGVWGWGAGTVTSLYRWRNAPGGSHGAQTPKLTRRGRPAAPFHSPHRDLRDMTKMMMMHTHL